MAGNGSDMDVEVINWCQFVPQRGPRGVRHVAPDGEDFCRKHQRNMLERETTAENKRSKDEREHRMKMLEEQAKRASALESQRYLDQQFKEHERNLQQKLEERYRTQEPPKPVRHNPQLNVDMQPVPPPVAPVVSEDAIQQRINASIAAALQQLPIAPVVSEDDIKQRINAAVADALRRAGHRSSSASESSYSSQPPKSSSRRSVSSRSSQMCSPSVSRKSSFSEVSLPSSRVSRRSSRPVIPTHTSSSSSIRSTRSSVGYSEDEDEYDSDFIDYESDDSVTSLSSQFSRSRIC